MACFQVVGPGWYIRTRYPNLQGCNCAMKNDSIGKPVLYTHKKLRVHPGLRPKRPCFQQLHPQVSLVEVYGEDYVSNEMKMSQVFEVPVSSTTQMQTTCKLMGLDRKLCKL